MSLILNNINSSNQPICCYKCPNTQRRRCSANIPMNVPTIMNVLTTQRHMFYTNISMNVFGNINALIVQCRRNYTSITMDVFAIANVTTTQLGTS
ncbi:MAG: hypothetical protein ACFNUM_04430, partial [Segatella salivae]